MLDVAGCGSMVVDHFYRTPRIIGPDQKILLDPLISGARSRVGGVVLNHLGWARVLGLNAGIFGKIGDDANGKILVRGMRQLGIRRHLTTDGSASAFAVILLDRRGDRSIYMSRGATAELTPSEIETTHREFIANSALVTTEISQLPLKTVISILKIAKAEGIQSILDIDIPPSDALGALGNAAQFERAVRLATFLKPAKAAARELSNKDDSLAAAKAIRTYYGSRAAIITEGAGGCVIATTDETLRIPAFRAKQVDSTGAGDAFMGGLIAGIRWGWSWPKIGRLANAAGAVCVTQVGAFPPNREISRQIHELFGIRAMMKAAPTSDALSPGRPPSRICEPIASNS